MCIEERKPILTFRIEDTAFTGAKKYYLKNINWIDAFPNPEKYFGELLKSAQCLLPDRTANNNSKRHKIEENTKDANLQFETAINEILIVPSYLNLLQRKATKEANEKAGLKFHRLLSEPLAVALGYYHNKSIDLKCVAVLVLDKGTLDISIIEIGDGVFEVLSTIGDAKIGSNIDYVCNRTKQLCTKSLQGARLNKPNIKLDEIILVGTLAYNPLIRQTIENIFGTAASNVVYPDKLAAKGAVVYSGIFTGKTTNVLLLDVIPLSLGIETMGGVMTKIIEANTTIPAKKIETFTTAVDNQPSVEIHLLQGESTVITENVSIGRFHLGGIPPAPKGIPQIEVIFDIDANGMLHVSARDKGTDKQVNININ